MMEEDRGGCKGFCFEMIKERMYETGRETSSDRCEDRGFRCVSR